MYRGMFCYFDMSSIILKTFYGNTVISLCGSPGTPLSRQLLSRGGYTAPCVFTATTAALSAFQSLHAQSADFSRVTPKDSDGHFTNHPVDLKYRPATKSHYMQ